jgi:hypothetical protein
MTRPGTVIQFVVSLALCLQTGCSAPPSLVELNDKIAEANRKLLMKAQELRKAVEPLRSGPGPDVAKVKPVIDAVGKLLEETKASFNNQPLPSRSSDSAPELVSAYQSFLQVEEKIYQDHFQAILPILESGDSPQVKWAKIETNFKAGAELEKPALLKLRDAQAKFAKEHFFMIVGSR